MNKLQPIPAILVLAALILLAFLPSAVSSAYPPPGDEPPVTPTITLTPTLRCGQPGRWCTSIPSSTRNAQRTGTAAVQETYEAKLTEWTGATRTAIASVTPPSPMPTAEEPPYPGPYEPTAEARWWEIFLPVVTK